MAAAVASRAISSADLSCLASSITCWPSRTSMPRRCSSKSTGSSVKSTPTGWPATPAAASLSLISATRRRGPAHRAVRGYAVLRLQPRAVHAVVHGGRPEVPQVQLPCPGVKGVPAQLVSGPLADGDAGQVPDVVVVEDEQRAE